MASQNSLKINFPKSALKDREGVILLPPKKWQRIEDDLEDFEMYRSEGLAEEITKRRTDKKTVFLETLLKVR